MYDANYEQLPYLKRSWRSITSTTPEIAAFALCSNRFLMLLGDHVSLLHCSFVAGLHEILAYMNSGASG